jgi:hypothetical protein
MLVVPRPEPPMVTERPDEPGIVARTDGIGGRAGSADGRDRRTDGIGGRSRLLQSDRADGPDRRSPCFARIPGAFLVRNMRNMRRMGLGGFHPPYWSVAAELVGLSLP